MKYRAWAIAFGAAQAFDVAITSVALTWHLADEMNPFALMLWQSAGAYGLALIKAVGTLAMLAIANAGWSWRPMQLWSWGLAIAMFGVGAWNTYRVVA